MKKVTDQEIYDIKNDLLDPPDGFMDRYYDIMLRLTLENRAMIQEIKNKKCGCNQSRINAVSSVKFDPLELNDNDVLAG